MDLQMREHPVELSHRNAVSAIAPAETTDAMDVANHTVLTAAVPIGTAVSVVLQNVKRTGNHEHAVTYLPRIQTKLSIQESVATATCQRTITDAEDVDD